MPIRQMTKSQILQALRMLDQGHSKTKVAEAMTVTRVTLRKTLKEYQQYGDAALDHQSKPYPYRSGSLTLIVDSQRIRQEYLDKADEWADVLYRKTG